MSSNQILTAVSNYYTEKVLTHGTTPSGVDWNSQESQELRFKQLLKVCKPRSPISITDYGCGYGALLDYLDAHEYIYEYQGFDIAEEMISRARKKYSEEAQCDFFAEKMHLQQTDYVVASGIFNVKLQTDDDAWLQYILSTLEELNNLSRLGFAFNVLTSYSDLEKMRPDLYYADPLFLFDYCKRQFSRFAALLHDYPLYEFTILVRK